MTTLFFKSSWMYYIACVILFLYASIQLRTLGNILHECVHNVFFRKRKDNIILGNIIAFIIFENFRDYKLSHLSHHYNTGDLQYDRDLKTRLFLAIHLKKTRRFYFRKVFSPLNTLRSLATIFYFPRQNKVSNLLKVSYLGVLIFFMFYFNCQWILLCFFLPYITFYQYLKYFSDIADHAGLTTGQDLYSKTRNHIFRLKVLNPILFPRNDAYHLIHHMYPSIGTPFLSKLHKYLLVHDPKYKEKNHYF